MFTVWVEIDESVYLSVWLPASLLVYLVWPCGFDLLSVHLPVAPLTDRLAKDSSRVLSVHRWLFPVIGHMGICTSAGVIRDFAGPYYVSVWNTFHPINGVLFLICLRVFYRKTAWHSEIQPSIAFCQHVLYIFPIHAYFVPDTGVSPRTRLERQNGMMLFGWHQKNTLKEWWPFVMSSIAHMV